jgi:RimJ/RimL family protein N-acetyltransferase
MNTTTLPDNIQGYGVELHRLQANDIERVRQWRNHPDVARHMVNNEHISSEQQSEWFKQVAGAVDRAYYIARYKGEPAAFASVTGETGVPLDNCKVLEAAIYLAPESRCRGTLLAFAPALALNDACFEVLACEKLIARVKLENETALRFNAQMGYEETGRDNEMVYMQLDYARYKAASQQIKQFLTRQHKAAS